jgi:CBS domain-containing protein
VVEPRHPAAHEGGADLAEARPEDHVAVGRDPRPVAEVLEEAPGARVAATLDGAVARLGEVLLHALREPRDLGGREQAADDAGAVAAEGGGIEVRHGGDCTLRSMSTRNIPVTEAGPSAADVMLRDPRAVPPGTTVAEARETFANPRVRLLLVAEGEAFLGAVTRDDVGPEVDDAQTLGALAGAAALVRPEDPVDSVVGLLDTEGTDRLPVVDGDGTLLGLICFNRKHGHFCVDA